MVGSLNPKTPVECTLGLGLATLDSEWKILTIWTFCLSSHFVLSNDCTSSLKSSVIYAILQRIGTHVQAKHYRTKNEVLRISSQLLKKSSTFFVVYMTCYQIILRKRTKTMNSQNEWHKFHNKVIGKSQL